MYTERVQAFGKGLMCMNKEWGKLMEARCSGDREGDVSAVRGNLWDKGKISKVVSRHLLRQF